MKRIQLLLLALLLALCSAPSLLRAQRPKGAAEKAFPQYTWVSIDQDWIGCRLGYDKSAFTLVNKATWQLSEADPFYAREDQGNYVYLGWFKTSAGATRYLLYSPGMSEDPFFEIRDEGQSVIWQSECCYELCLNPAGTIYTAGHANQNFEARRVYKIRGSRIEEVPQPFLYVGLKGKLRQGIKLYSRPFNTGEVVATCPKGYEVEFLLCREEQDEYGSTVQNSILVRSKFGLVGWVTLTQEQVYPPNVLLEGFGYWGD